MPDVAESEPQPLADASACGVTRYSWFTHPDEHICLAARPEGVTDAVALVVARVGARVTQRPRMLLPLIGSWFALLLAVQGIVQPDVARVLWPVVVPALVGCVVAMVAARRGRLSTPAAWRIVSVLANTQIVTYIAGFFLAGFGAYQTAIVIEVLAIAILDVRGRAMQVTVVVVAVGWAGGTCVAPATDELVWNLLALVGACSVGLVVHYVTMRSTYAAEWLRRIDDRRADDLATARAATAQQLRHRQRAERKLQRTIGELTTAQARLLQAQKLEAIGQLAAGVAHEINTPTQYVSDNTTFLQGAFDKLLGAVVAARGVVEASSTPDAELARDALQKARLDYHARQVPRAIDQSLEGLRRIASLVAALKEFSHPSAGVKAPVDLNLAIQATITITRNEWKYVAEVTTDLDPTLPPVWCMRDELSQVVLNLLVNASHAIGECQAEGQALGKIAVRTRAAGDHVTIEITDDGAGIPETIRHRIFEPFFTTKPMGKGTGQGLAISHAVIVDKHQGTIDVASEPGRGTTFTVRIPTGASEAIAA